MEDIPENFFVCEEYKLYTEEIGDFSQSFYASPAASTDYDLTGQVLWPGAKHLSTYILNNRSLFEHKTILELGSGSGLCGLFCSQIAERMVLSDGNDIVMRLLEKNKNFGKNVEVVFIDWACNNPNENLKKLGLPEKYEVIIGTDVVYWSDSIIPLFSTVGKLLESGGQFFMCYTLRANNTFRDLNQLSQEMGFEKEILWQEDCTYIFRYTKKDE